MGFFRRRGLIITLVVLLILGLAGGSLAYFISSNSAAPPAIDTGEVIANLPEAELMWFSQPQDVKDQICGGLAANPTEYYELMKETWLQDSAMDPEMFGALMTTIIDDCGL